jgi:FAD/FMN-containing dehydrogenase
VRTPNDAYRLLLAAQNECEAMLEGFEILPGTAMEHVLRHIPGTRSPLDGAHEWHVLIELAKDGAEQRSPALLAEDFLTRQLEAGLIRDAAIAANETQAEAFWKIRDSIAEAERAEGPALQHDISVPVSAMARFIEAESPDLEARYPGTSVIAFGHLGDGNIHFHIKAPKGAVAEKWYAEHSATISGDVYDRVNAYGGSISAEHGIGQAKLAEFVRLADPARLTALHAIKRAFDPLNIMNPGKLVPLASGNSAA